MRRKCFQVGLVILLVTGISIILFYLFSEKVDEPDFFIYQKKIDSLKALQIKYETQYNEIINDQSALINYYDSVYKATRIQFDSLLHSMGSLTVDQHMRLLTDELSQKDSITR